MSMQSAHSDWEKQHAENFRGAIYHSPRYVADPSLPRYVLPCCGKLVNRDGWLALVGREPPTTRRRPNAWKAKP